jgi:putative copper resistance protein D
VGGVAAAVRWVQLVAGGLLVGVFAGRLLVLRPAARAAGAEAPADPLDRRLGRLAAGALAVAVGAGLLDLWRQTSVATGLDLRASLSGSALAAVLLGTQYGTVWLVRHGLLLLLGALLVLADTEQDARDWLALRLQGLLMGALSFGALAAAGHAASAQQLPGAAIAIDALHLLATGIWLGGLPVLALALRWAARLPGRAGAVVAAEAARRFSALGLVAVGTLGLTGLYNAWEQVGGFAALFGTPYGRWLCAKLALLAPLVAVAAVNLLVLKPRLARAVATRPAPDPVTIRRVTRNVGLEAALGLVVLGVVAVMVLTTPARHVAPDWPFGFRFSWAATKLLPGVQTRVAIGSQLVLLGLIAALLAALVRRRGWRPVVAGGAAAALAGLWVALPPLAIDAYPTTYARPVVPYSAASVADGLALYRQHCTACHGPAGYGDGPAGTRLRPPPADLTARHAGDHTAGDLFWWVTHGIAGSAMPGFGDRLGDEERWSLVNAVRALGAAEAARRLRPTATEEPQLVVPDLAFTTGVGESHSLKDYRGERIVVLALFTLPGSRPRLLELASVYPSLRLLGAEVIGIPLDDPSAVYRALGPAPVFFPIVVDGAEEAAATYGLLGRDGGDGAPSGHVELLVDRQGYLRARWIMGRDGDGWADPARLVAEVQRLAREPARPVAAEHVH